MLQVVAQELWGRHEQKKIWSVEALMTAWGIIIKVGGATAAGAVNLGSSDWPRALSPPALEASDSYLQINPTKPPGVRIPSVAQNIPFLILPVAFSRFPDYSNWQWCHFHLQMARLLAKRRPRQNQTNRSVDYLNDVSTNVQDDDDENPQAEDSERDIDPESDDEHSEENNASPPRLRSGRRRDAGPKRTIQAERYNLIGVVLNSGNNATRNINSAESANIRESYAQDKVNSNRDGEIPESDQDYVSSEDSDSSENEDAAEDEDAAEESSERHSVEQTASRRRRTSTEREEPTETQEVAENTNRWTPVPHPRTRIVDSIEGGSPRTNESSSRRKRRATDVIESEPQSTRRRRTNSGNIVPTGGNQPEEFEEWEASMVVETAPAEEVVVIYDETIYDDATTIMGLERPWRDLMDACKKVKAIETDETKTFKGIKDICDRIQASMNIYKQIQRDRSTESITPTMWEHAEHSLRPISDDVEVIRLKIMRRANEGKDSNDLRIKADANEYAEQIYKHVMTDLSELALECLKAYYSDDQRWLLSKGFTAVMNILDISGKIMNTLRQLEKAGSISMTRDISRHIRLPLRIIYDTLSRCEMEERQRER
jgi:hypothetical protein